MANKVYMQTIVAIPKYDRVVVNVPHLELKKFKAIVKALGFTIEKKSELQKAIDEVESGNVIQCSSLDELINSVG